MGTVFTRIVAADTINFVPVSVQLLFEGCSSLRAATIALAHARNTYIRTLYIDTSTHALCVYLQCIRRCPPWLLFKGGSYFFACALPAATIQEQLLFFREFIYYC